VGNPTRESSKRKKGKELPEGGGEIAPLHEGGLEMDHAFPAGTDLGMECEVNKRLQSFSGEKYIFDRTKAKKNRMFLQGTFSSRRGSSAPQGFPLRGRTIMFRFFRILSCKA